MSTKHLIPKKVKVFFKPRTLSFTEYDWITGGASQDRKDIKQLLTENKSNKLYNCYDKVKRKD